MTPPELQLARQTAYVRASSPFRYPPRFPDARWPHARAHNQWAILEALLHGERLTVGVALERYHVYALSQECGRLRKLNWPVQSKLIKTDSGKHIAEYSL